MEKNEAFRKQVLSRLYGLPDPTATETAKQESGSAQTEKSSSGSKSDKTGADEKSGTDNDTKTVIDNKKDSSAAEKERGEEDARKEVKKELGNNNSKESVATVTDTYSGNSGKSMATHTTPTTTTSHLYSVLMAPLDGHSPYREHALRFGLEDPDSGPRKRMRLDTPGKDKGISEHKESNENTETKNNADTNVSVGMDLTKNQKRKVKKKKRKHLLNKLEVQRAKEFIYSSENEQFSLEKLRTMIEDVTEFLDAIWDVYCSEDCHLGNLTQIGGGDVYIIYKCVHVSARLKGESVEEDGYKAAAVLKCLEASGESSWADLQLLSRAKSVLVLRNKNLAASTIARVETEISYAADIRNFIVRMLKFWMGEIVTKG